MVVMDTRYLLIADIGGTHARFCPLNKSFDARTKISDKDCLTLDSAAFPNFDALLETALKQLPIDPRRTTATLAIAGPIQGAEARLTNLEWTFNTDDLQYHFNFSSLNLINDVEAAALGLAAMDSDCLGFECLQTGNNSAPGRNALINVGTGLGVAYWHLDSPSIRVEKSEAGHMGFAPTGNRQLSLLHYLQERHERISWERVLSGSGLSGIEVWLTHGAIKSPAEIVESAMQGNPIAADAISRFCLMLGAYAGDIALAAPAFGGVWLTGGVLDGLGDYFNKASFLAGIKSKGRMQSLAEDLPIHRLHRDQLLGLSGAWYVASESTLI